MAEATVQVSPAGGGPKVRTLEVTTAQADGTFATVEMQVVAIADSLGNVLAIDSDGIVQQLKTTNALLRMVSTQLGLMSAAHMTLDELTYIDQPITAS